MANRVPFTAYMKITPERGDGKRWEIQRGRERLAYQIATDLAASFSDGNMALPGSSGEWGLAANGGSLSSLINISAVKPQFGEDPETVMIEGFYAGDQNALPYGEATLIYAGESRTGPASGAPGWNANYAPSAACLTQVKALKTALEAAITSVTVEITKIDYSGVSFGQGGHHFPR